MGDDLYISPWMSEYEAKEKWDATSKTYLRKVQCPDIDFDVQDP